MTDKNKPDTRDKILVAAEKLFIEKGYSATSLRAIAGLAEVNLAATHYHFGSKSGLLNEVFHCHVQVLNERRLNALEALEASDEVMTLENVMATFFSPFTDFEIDDRFNKLMGRLYGEPETLVKPLLKREFGELGKRYVIALHKIRPDIRVEELQWRLHFVVGAMIQLLNFETPLHIKQTKATQLVKFKRLHAFAVAGIRQAEASQAEPIQSEPISESPKAVEVPR